MSDVTIAASSDAFHQLFNAIRDHFHLSKAGSSSFGPFTVSYSLALHLEGGDVQLNDDNTIEISDVDVVWDTLVVTPCFTLPGFCVGGWCIVPDPWDGCLVSFPGFCIGGETICAPLNLSGLVSEISDLTASLLAKYFVDPARLSSWSDLDAEFKGHPNKWQIFIDPVHVHVDPIDLPATLGNILEQLVKDAINNLIPSWVPDWAKDLLWAIIGPILDLVKDILGIVGEVSEWVANLLNSVFDLLGIIETAVADHFASQYPVYEFEDPYPILAPSGALIPVKIPIRNLNASVNSKEMIVRADVGA